MGFGEEPGAFAGGYHRFEKLALPSPVALALPLLAVEVGHHGLQLRNLLRLLQDLGPNTV